MATVFRLIMGLCALFLSAGLSAEPVLDIKPDRCVALHQGQVCYQSLKFTWQTPGEGKYCLFEHSNPSPIVCWTGDQRTSYKKEFKSEHNITYEIRAKDGDKQIASKKVKVAWVYKSNRKSTRNWRLF